MPVLDTVTYEQTPPKRPGEADILDGVKENITATVPPHMPNAAEYMQMARQIAAFGKMTPIMRLSIDHNAGAPFIHSFVTVRNDHVIGDFTVTDLGAGRTRIEWPANRFPASNTRGMATTNRPGANAGIPNVELIANGFEVYTTTDAGVATDMPVTVEIF